MFFFEVLLWEECSRTDFEESGVEGGYIEIVRAESVPSNTYGIISGEEGYDIYTISSE